MRRSTQARSSDAASRDGEIPAPFGRAPAALKPFLDSLDVSQVYIVHLDKFPPQFKRKIFIVPVVLNLAIGLLLLLRWYYVFPDYFELLLYMLGQPSNAVVDVASKTRGQILWIIFRRVLMFFIDFVLIKFILPWPISFFFERPANPVSWRRSVGFQSTEIIVRVSRNWSAADLTESLKQGDQNPFFKVRILPAIDQQFMREKTGYLMMGKDFDLDFGAMIFATDLVKNRSLQFEHFQKTVLVYYEKHGWLAWEFYKLDGVTEEEAGRNIVQFRDRLAAMGKESLFFRWVELMQFESSQPGGFTPERQQAAVTKAKELFQEQGVDLDEILAAIGGTHGFPGLDAT